MPRASPPTWMSQRASRLAGGHRRHEDLAGRPTDIEVASAIVATRGDALDCAYVKATIDAMERALGQSDLRPILERIVAGRRGELG